MKLNIINKKKIAFQGIPGAYSHLACKNVYQDFEPLSCTSFEEMISAVQDKKAELAMVPVENSTAGRVADIHNILPESGLYIIGEYYLRVNHMLLGTLESSINSLKEVRSHGQGLAQCKIGIQNHKLNPYLHTDTAGAAKEISNLNNPEIGAIASELASEIYGLKILKRNFEDNDHNTTRFLIMSKEALKPDLDKELETITTIIFSTRSVPAALYKALGGFATNGINLTKLESYMKNGKMTAVQFYVDIEGHPDSQSMKFALEELKFFCGDNNVKIMGTYPASNERKKL
tara:strand:- start:1252 stop:2118 length:867 start_codon:yes stop_codon:yes gene_type:complete